jgi:hypothetical protein
MLAEILTELVCFMCSLPLEALEEGCYLSRQAGIDLLLGEFVEE